MGHMPADVAYKHFQAAIESKHAFVEAKIMPVCAKCCAPRTDPVHAPVGLDDSAMETQCIRETNIAELERKLAAAAVLRQAALNILPGIRCKCLRTTHDTSVLNSSCPLCDLKAAIKAETYA